MILLQHLHCRSLSAAEVPTLFTHFLLFTWILACSSKHLHHHHQPNSDDELMRRHRHLLEQEMEAFGHLLLPKRTKTLGSKHPHSQTVRIVRHHRRDPECSTEQMLQAEGVQQALMASLLDDNGPFGVSLLGKPTEEAQKPTTEGGGAGRNCSSRPGRRRHKGHSKRTRTEIKPDMSLELLAVCPYERLTNFDGHRIPKRIPEVRCLCNQPRISQQTMFAPIGDQMHCEPLYSEMQVLKFEPDCRKFKAVIQRISLGCVAAFKAHSQSGSDQQMGQPLISGPESAVI